MSHTHSYNVMLQRAAGAAVGTEAVNVLKASDRMEQPPPGRGRRSQVVVSPLILDTGATNGVDNKVS